MIVEYIRYKVDLDRGERFVQAYELASRALDQSEFCRGYELRTYLKIEGGTRSAIKGG